MTPIRVRTGLAPLILVFVTAFCALMLAAHADDAGPTPQDAVSLAASLLAGSAAAAPAPAPSAGRAKRALRLCKSNTPK